MTISKAKEFHFEEWKSLRDELATQLKEMYDTERNVVIASFGIWVWFLTQNRCDFSPALLLPVIAVLLGAWRCWAIGSVVGIIGIYLRKIELIYGSPVLGWEQEFRGRSGDQQHALGRTSRAFWVLLAVASILIAVAGHQKVCDENKAKNDISGCCCSAC